MSAETTGHVAHHNVTVLTTDDKSTMDAFVASSTLRGLIWKRLDATHALVDSERVALLVQRLKELGHAPRFSQTVGS